MRKWKIYLIDTLIVLLFVGVAIFFVTVEWNERRAVQAHQEASVMYHQRTAEHQLQVTMMEQQIRSLNQPLVYCGERSHIMVGFTVVELTDIDYVRDKAETYRFQPVVIIDPLLDTEQIDALVDAADPDWEIMLYAESMSGASLVRLLSAKSHLSALGRPDCGVIYCLSDSLSVESRSLLKDSGFTGFTLYSEAPGSGQTDDDMVYFDYTYIISGGIMLENRLSTCLANQASMLYVFNLASIYEERISEEQVTQFLDMIQTTVEDNGYELSTVAETVVTLSQVNQKKQLMEEERKQEIRNLEQQIDELLRLMDEIRAECFAGLDE